MNRTAIRTAAALALSLGLAGCSSSTSESADDTQGAPNAPVNSAYELPETVVSKGAVDIATDINYPPWSTGEEGGVKTGIEPDLIRVVQDKMGVSLNLHDLASDVISPSLTNGRMDMAIGTQNDNPDIYDDFTFLNLWSVEMRVLVKKGNPAGVDPADLCGRTAGATTGYLAAQMITELSEECVQAGKPAINLLTFPDGGTQFLAVTNGRTEFAIQDAVLAEYMAEQNPDLEVIDAPIPGAESVPSGWMFPTGDTTLVCAFHAAITDLADEGAWQDELAEHGIGDFATIPPTINRQPAEATCA